MIIKSTFEPTVWMIYYGEGAWKIATVKWILEELLK